MDNMINTNFNRKLPVPKEIKEQYPLSAEATAKKEIRDKEIKEVFTGESDKLALVIGPCSADRSARASGAPRESGGGRRRSASSP